MHRGIPSIRFVDSSIQNFDDWGTTMGRILIADDHDSLRRGLAQAIAEAGHEVEEAPNGNAAIEKLHEGFFDVIVSDLKMGGSTGLDVLKTAKTLHPSCA